MCVVIAGCSLAFSLVNLYFNMPMSATVSQNPSLKFYVDEAEWLNNTEVAWGNVSPDSSAQKSLDILNDGNVALLITLTSSNLPTDWDLAYDRNGTVVDVGTWLNGTMTLTIPASTAEATYYWTASINAT